MAKKQNPLIAEAVEAVAEVEQDAALAQVWERRMVNPLQTASAGVELKQKGYTLHWIDTSRQGRFYVATREQGWVPVKPEELQDSVENLGLTNIKDGTVRRGLKGEEVLMKMPTKIFKKIQTRKAEVVIKQIRNTKKNLSTALGNRFGDQAAEFGEGKGNIERDGTGGLKGEILDSFGDTAVK